MLGIILGVSEELGPLYLSAERIQSEVKSFNHVQLFVTAWTVAYQAPPSMEFSRQEYWSGLPLPSPRVSTKEVVNKQMPNNMTQDIYFV